MKIVVAGATGTLGRHVVSLLQDEGHQPVPVARSHGHDLRRPDTLSGVCEQAGAVISCAGAPMQLGGTDRSSFYAVDHKGNANLLQAAQRSGVRKFVYVSLACGPELRRTEYADAHERFVDELKASGMKYAVIRPTGFFGFMREILTMAQKGRAVVMGDGSARTNPVHERDVAQCCVAAITNDMPDVPVGGPDIFTRREIVEMALRIANRETKIHSLPPRLLRAAITPLRLMNPRLHALMHFGIEVSLQDVIAPPRGDQRLETYFRRQVS